MGAQSNDDSEAGPPSVFAVEEEKESAVAVMLCAWVGVGGEDVVAPRVRVRFDGGEFSLSAGGEVAAESTASCSSGSTACERRRMTREAHCPGGCTQVTESGNKESCRSRGETVVFRLSDELTASDTEDSITMASHLRPRTGQHVPGGQWRLRSCSITRLPRCAHCCTHCVESECQTVSTELARMH